MTFNKMFGQPYLDADDGANLGGGGQLPDDDAISLEDDTLEQEPDEQAENPEGTKAEVNPADTKPEEQKPDETPPTEEPQKVKLKFNHEEKEIPLDEALILAQKGMNYDKIQEKFNALQNDPRLSFVELMAKRSNMTVDEYLVAVKAQEEQAELAELVQKNIPEEYAKEMIENRKFRESLQAKQKQEEETRKQEKEYQDFFAAFPGTKPEDIKPETWQKVADGMPLKYAFMDQRNSQSASEYQKQLEALKAENEALKQNNANKAKAPIKGGVTSHGGNEPTTGDPFLDGFDSY